MNPIRLMIVCANLHLPSVAALINVTLVAVGYVAPIGFGSLAYLGPTISVATEHVQKKYYGTIGFELQYLYHPVSNTCSDLSDIATDMVAEWHYWKRKPTDLTVYIIPTCVEATQMPYFQSQWNNLWISTMSASPQIRNRQLYPSWIATNYFSVTQCSEWYVEILNKFGWTTTFFVIDTASPPFYSILATMLLDDLKKTVNSTQFVRRIVTKAAIPYGQFQPLLEDIKKVSRVVLYFGHAAFLREFLIAAASMNMTNGEYVYIAVETMKNKMLGRMHWQYNDSNDQIAFQAYQFLLAVHPRDINLGPDPILGLEFVRRSQSDYNFTYPLSDQPFIALVDSYLAITSLGQVLNDSLTNGMTAADLTGIYLAKGFSNRSFRDDGGGGTIYVDSNGQRRSDFTISHFTAGCTREPFLHKMGKTQSTVEVTRLRLWGSASFPPPNEPFCGYLNQRSSCQPKRDKRGMYDAVAGFFGACLAIGVVSVCCIKYIRRKADARLLLNPWWQITIAADTELSRYQSRISSVFHSVPQKHLEHKLHSIQDNTSFRDPQLLCFCTSYQGELVISVSFCLRDYSMTFQELSADHDFLELIKKFYGIEHPNLCRFYGLTIKRSDMETHILSAVYERPTRGSLPEISGSFVTKDFGFTSSLIVDYLDAVDFIHSSLLRYHGRISTAACWVDKHFTLKVMNLGLDRLERGLCNTVEGSKKMDYSAAVETLYWLTPETADNSDVTAVQGVDIYSSGFVIYDMLTKAALYNKFRGIKKKNLQPTALSNGRNLFLESVNFADFPQFEQVLQSCWNPNPIERPSIRRLRSRISEISPLLKSDSSRTKLVDKIYKRLSDYSVDLEQEVANRTAGLRDEMYKCDAIIGQFLPRAIVRQMRSGQAVEAELYDCVSVMFTDLFGFADYVSGNPPEQTISLIGETEACFDRLSTKYDVYKVEAIGDSYLTASGLPIRNGNDHIRYIAAFALGLIHAEHTLTSLKDLRFKMGIHSGPCAAGVLGLRRPRYCLFGDTINMGSRMCYHGLPGRIHISSDSQLLLVIFPEFLVERRGMVAVKGKHEMTTYWLNGCRAL